MCGEKNVMNLFPFMSCQKVNPQRYNYFVKDNSLKVYIFSSLTFCPWTGSPCFGNIPPPYKDGRRAVPKVEGYSLTGKKMSKHPLGCSHSMKKLLS